MFRVTRKQKIVQDGNTIEFEDSCDSESRQVVDTIANTFLDSEVWVGAKSYGPNKVIFETPSFYRSVTVTIEAIQ